MTITIDKNGAHVAVEAVRGQPESPMPTNGAELVAYWEKKGVIGTRPGITDSVAYARALRRQAETRQH